MEVLPLNKEDTVDRRHSNMVATADHHLNNTIKEDMADVRRSNTTRAISKARRQATGATRTQVDRTSNHR